MKFKLGDKVSFLDDQGGGIVKKIIDENIVHVEIEDGFEIPVVVSNLILVSSRANYDNQDEFKDNYSQTTNTETDEDITPLNLSKGKEKLPEEGIYFAIVPENQDKPLAGKLMLFLINYSDYQVLFSLFTNESGVFYGFDFGYLQPNSRIFLDTIERTSIEKWVNALVQVNFFKEGKLTVLQPLSHTVDFKPVKTYKEDAFRYENLLGSKAIMVQIGLKKNQVFNPYSSKDFSEDKLKLYKKDISQNDKPEKESRLKPKSFLDKHKLGDKAAEVDLHIHKLVDDFTNLENKDLIEIQLDYFRKCLLQAEKERYLKIIFIHGIGDGVLKNEIIKQLKKTEGIQYYDAPYNRFGMGATEVLFYRNK